MNEVDSFSSLPIAGFWVRLGGLLVDGCFYFFIVALSILLTKSMNRAAAEYVALAVVLIYSSTLIAMYGQTPGMALCGIQAIDIKNGSVRWPNAILRSIGFILSHFLWLGFLIAALNPERRTFHDFIAGTKVVYQATENSITKTLRRMGIVALLLLPAAFWLRTQSPTVDRAVTAVGHPTQSEQMVRLSATWQHSQNLKGLGTVRERLYHQTNGWKSVAPTTLTDVPEIHLPDHLANHLVTVYGAEACAGNDSNGHAKVAGDKIKDTGGWGYISAQGSACDGDFFFDCTHIDNKNGHPYFEW